MTTIHTPAGNITITTDDTNYTISAKPIPIGDNGYHSYVYATWSPGDTTIDIRIDVNALELNVDELQQVHKAIEQAHWVVAVIRVEWRAWIDAHREAENAAA